MQHNLKFGYIGLIEPSISIITQQIYLLYFLQLFVLSQVRTGTYSSTSDLYVMTLIMHSGTMTAGATNQTLKKKS